VAPVIAASAPAESAAGLIELPSPLLGTFYRAPKPGAPPFIEVGSEVGPETVIGLVETMKLMNSVYAGVKGRVAEICAADAQFVEQGVVLARIEPAA
jgi:acetyl-CoA carboxylase biotin carboxyl carrier protein